VTTAGRYQSSSNPRVHFGVGTAAIVKLVEIHWPSGVVQSLHDVNADQVVQIKEAALTTGESLSR
jgi:enediyne biosynthesis protein E4